jgi:hypothetical protein
MKYALRIYTGGNTTSVRDITDVRCGTFGTVNFAAKEARPELDSVADGEGVRVELNELDSEGNFQNSLLGMEADAGTVGDVLKARLARLRKSLNSEAPAAVNTSNATFTSEHSQLSE